jgi:autotransporter-associated beta strand protein
MKMNVKNPSASCRARLFANRLWLCAPLTLLASLPAVAQQTVFNDTFGSSTVSGISTPGGTFTASSTSYDIGAPKAISTLASVGTAITPGRFAFGMLATSSAYVEGQAIFTAHPVTLAVPGDSVDIQSIFTATTNLFTGGPSDTMALGLFNSGGSVPYTNLYNNGFVSTTTTAASGGVQNWVGYRGDLAYGGSTAGAGVTATSITYSRPAQNQGNNLNQVLIQTGSGGSLNGVNLGQNANTITPLTIGNQYTLDFRITLQTNGSLAMANTLFAGVGNGGAVLATNIATAAGANVLTTNFDALCLGGRRTGSVLTTNYINQIIVTFTSSNQAGPYFNVASSGNPCTGSVDVTLDGSVTTNAYLLYTNGVYNGQSLAGTGAALDFGVQTAPATYTVIASNLVTGSMGPMVGKANVFAPGVTIALQPNPVSVVSNLPASFSVAAIGANLSYQWYKNGIPLTNNANLSGAQTTNLNFVATGAGDVATYTVVAQTPCGDSITSSPPAALTITPPRNLVWAGGNPINNWNYTDAEFTLSGSPTIFAPGDNATFDDTSAYQSVTISNDLTSSLVSVVGTKNYVLSGPNKLVGVSRVAVGGSATLTLVNDNNFSGGTVVSNGATLAIGDGTSTKGSLTGTVTVNSGGTLNYSSASPAITGTINILNGFAGSGTVNFNDAAGATYATAANLVINSNFTGTININGFTALHASSGNAGYALGNGSIINAIGDNGNNSAPQIWLDPSATAYNNTFNLAGTGWEGLSPFTGALRLYNCTVNGPINLLADARIGGTINGGTIQSVISGPHQLEVWGNTNSFVLIMGPTNGLPQAYASTLITGGSIQAANRNAISTGPLTLDSGGDLRLFGNNLTVANLSSINSGQILLIEGPRIRNMNTTNAATLTVGTDGNNTEFDGTFSDGAAGTFGLTKVGSGTLTLTGINTNTGAVTVNGGTLALSGSASFGKALQLIANSGGFYDVTGAGGTLTLNSGQTLRGNGGTVKGALVAPAGSTVAPGFPLGTLTVSGTATVSGTYRASLNRTNVSGNCSQFTSSGGSITYSGATLSVTNLGPKLQAGDFFQLFPAATAGFATVVLPTNDVPNNAIYTWNNTVATDGRITLTGVSVIVNTAPTNIVSSVANGVLTLSWPADHTGWTLQTQTNSLSKGLSTNWVDVAGSAATNKVIIPIGSTNGSVFFRMKY